MSRRFHVDLTDPSLVAAKMVDMERDCGLQGAEIFRAHAPVLDWGCVKMQVLVLHGCAKIVGNDG